MEKLNLKLTLLILLSCFCQFSFAQKSGQIKGIVSDEKGVLEFVDINLKKITDTTKTVGYTTTDTKGNFAIENIANGDYLIQFKLMSDSKQKKIIDFLEAIFRVCS
jgi:hypothetical protein